MKAHLLLALASLALAVAKDYRPINEQASPGHHISPNIKGRSLAHKPQYWDYDEGGSGNDRDDDSEGGPDYEDGKPRADVEGEDPKSESAQTKDPSFEDTTVVPPTTADAQAEDPPESEPTAEESSPHDGGPWPADEDATTLPPTSTADADANNSPKSEPTQKDPSYEDPPDTKEGYTTTITSTSTGTHFITVPFPSSSTGVINAVDPAELAESPPDVGNRDPVSVVPVDTRSANSSVAHPTGPGSQLCSWPCEGNSPIYAEGRSPEPAIPSIESRPSAWPTKAPSGLATAVPWNRTVASEAVPRKTPADDDEMLSDGIPWRHETPEPTDTADAVRPPATGEHPEGPTTEPLPPPGWSPTTGATASRTDQVEGTSGTRKWVPDMLFAGGVFVLMALLGQL